MTQLWAAWVEFQSKLDGVVEEANKVAERVWTDNKGPDVDAFKTSWKEPENGVDTLQKNASGTTVVGALTIACAIVVLMLKIWVIIQLVLLAIAIAQAIATAAVTFGASLLEIPVFKEIFGRIINLLISQAIGVLLG